MSCMLSNKVPLLLIAFLFVLIDVVAANVKIVGGVNHSINGFFWGLYKEHVVLEGNLVVSMCKDNAHLTYCGLKPDQLAASSMMPGQPYNHGCKKIYHCKSGT